MAGGAIPQTVLITGGCGFIGSNFLNLLIPRHPEIRFVNVDALTYAGNPANLAAVSNADNYEFAHVDIRDANRLEAVFDLYRPDMVVHFAAESHVDRSITGPRQTVETNVIGTLNLLEAARHCWGDIDGKVFHHVSTDEVYGSLGATGFFTEDTPYDPSSPYSASKAASDHLVRSHHRTFGLPVKVTNCSNNYGPYHFPEKLIPLMTLNCLDRRKLPVYGDGSNVRDWLYVTDHCEAIWLVATQGKIGETYNVGGNSERTNLEVVNRIIDAVSNATGASLEELQGLITYVTDRPGHDWRYAIDASKIQKELGWQPSVTFEEGIKRTVQWYIDNPEWIDSVKSGEYRKWIDHNYGQRGEANS
jgi:dTDP-glucose 4,6-dehydratase